jgi:hypothetical protein
MRKGGAACLQFSKKQYEDYERLLSHDRKN